jgi:tetratricopeptide (TPR) repeat protein
VGGCANRAPRATPPPAGDGGKVAAADLDELNRLNSLAIGYLDQFDEGRGKAIELFREIVRKAPDWTTGRVNLAIALLNTAKPDALGEAQSILREIVAKEPENAHAHYSLAVILSYQGETQPAAAEFEKVTQLDPHDAHAWYNLGQALSTSDIKRASEYLRRAAELNPNLSSAVYALQGIERRAGHKDDADKLLERFKALQASKWEEKAAVQYGEMGKYAEPIGKPARPADAAAKPLPLFQPVDKLKIELAAGARWATTADLDSDATAKLRARAQARFGITAATCDFDQDGQLDILLLGAVVEAGKVRDLLLHNEGKWQFQDVTAAAGLAEPRPSLGCAFGDFDNDGLADLYIACAGPNYLFRNLGKGKFQDVTQAAGVAGSGAVSLTAAFLDLDQDADLDIYVANYCAATAAADAFGDKRPAAVPNECFVNVGKAGVAPPDSPAPLGIAFKPAADPALCDGVATVGVTAADCDADYDTDLVLVGDAGPPILVLNDRLMHFHRQPIGDGAANSGPATGVAAGDPNKDGRCDIVCTELDAPVKLLVRKTPPRPGAEAPGAADRAIAFEATASDVKSLRHARLVDVDLDGWTDLVGLSSTGQPVLGRNTGKRLELAGSAFPTLEPAGQRADSKAAGDPKAAGPAALVVSDLDGDGPADLLLVTAAGPSAARNLGNGNHWVKLRLTGARDEGTERRTSEDGGGADFAVHAGGLVVPGEVVSPFLGLGQAYEPLLIGLGAASEIDAVRVRWPDATIQAEVKQKADTLLVMKQTRRRGISCPILFTWNGDRFEYVADFLGGGGLGYLLVPGQYNVPDPDEAVKIEPHQLVPRDGRLRLQIAEPMDEVTYLDRVQLVAIDHPADWQVYPDERFAALGTRPEWRLFAFQERITPRAKTHRGRDVTDILHKSDRRAVDDFYLRGLWSGYAEEHWIELDFGDRLARFGPNDPLLLGMAGWVEYPFSETNYAAATAGVALQPPTIERLGDDGTWHTLFESAGHPAGSPKLMTLDVTGRLTGPRCVLRVSTNMQVYWDHMFVAAVESNDGIRVQPLAAAAAASLGFRGHLVEYLPGGTYPTQHDYQRVDSVELLRQAGRHTRLGDVRELVAEQDDQFVIFGAGDDLSLEFDATALPPLPSGWQRSYVLRTWGYCKSADPLTAHGETIEPLPFSGMSGYPFRRDERPAHADALRRYQETYNTRVFGP